MDLEIGDIGFTYRKGSPISWLINIFSKIEKDVKISHVFIYIGDNLISESFFDGVSNKPIDKYLSGKYNVVIKRMDLTDNEKDCLWRYSQEFKGKVKYGYMQLVLLLIKKIYYNFKIFDWSKNQMICSEYIATLFELIGKEQKIPYYKQTPHTIYQWDFRKVILPFIS